MPNCYKILLLSITLALASCNSKEDDYTAYFGGEVANPQVKYVIFSRGNTALDTIPLDKNNRFFIKFDSLTPGLYSFKHDPEYQYVYFDKNDSLMVSINTGDFDKSIVFSGKGERKNNFMMELFLQHEKDRSEGYEKYNYDLDKFNKNIDSVYALRKAFYDRKKKAIKWSDGFDFYAKSRVDLNYFTKKEYYPYVHNRRTGEEAYSKLPADYYNYRKNIDFNDHRLISFSPFNRYLNAMLNNKAILRGRQTKEVEENALRDNIMKLNIADSMFTNKTIKNEVLDNIAFSYLLEDQNILNNQKFLERYMQLSTDKSESNEIRRIGSAIKVLKPGNKLPQISLVDVNNKSFAVDGEMAKETVIFFWTTCARSHLKMVVDKVNELKAQRPNLNFIAVNVDGDNEWKKVVTHYDFKNALQLRAANFQALKEKWVLTKINRTIILNPDGTIKNAFTNLMDDKFEESLK